MSTLADRILELRQQSMTFIAIAERLSLAENTVTRIVAKLRADGVPVPDLHVVWTPELDERVRTMAAQKLSAAKIAVALGPGFTRNSVVSRCNRFGIQLQGKLGAPAGPRRAPKPAITLVGGKQVPQNRMGNATVARHPAQRGPRARPSAPSTATGPYAVTLAALSDSPIISQCRWPIGDPKGTATVFCGVLPKDGSSPYCGYHHRLAYRPRGTVEP